MTRRVASEWVYAYDPLGRLARQIEPNATTRTVAYDRNGNKTGTSERGTLRWPRPSARDESASYTPSGRLIERQLATPDGAAAVSYQHDASGNMILATGDGQSWALSYDEDNRTRSIRWESGQVSRTITNRYDALGRRVARVLDGVETRYVLDLAGSMERILCDIAPDGQIAAWYVHGPDLAYRVDAANGLTCYHADAMANIIALTDGLANTVAQYAYTPYGRVLGSTNLQPSALSPQPFLFVGAQGVMEELPGLYFMRARYYSADTATFLSTDPVKRIGPGWRPLLYEYVQGQPHRAVDPSGETLAPLDFIDIEWPLQRILTRKLIDWDILKPYEGHLYASDDGSYIYDPGVVNDYLDARFQDYVEYKNRSNSGNASQRRSAHDDSHGSEAEEDGQMGTTRGISIQVEVYSAPPSRQGMSQEPIPARSRVAVRTVPAYNNATLANVLMSASPAARQVMMRALESDPTRPDLSGGGSGGGGTDRLGRTVKTDGAGSEYYDKGGGRRDYSTASIMKMVKERKPPAKKGRK